MKFLATAAVNLIVRYRHSELQKKLCHLIPNATVRVDYLWALSRRQEMNIIAVATSITSSEMPIETAMPTVTETVRPPAAVVQ